MSFFVYILIESYVHIHPPIHIHSFVTNSCICLPTTYLFLNSCPSSPISSPQPFNYISIEHLLFNLCTYLRTHSLTYSPTHSLTTSYSLHTYRLPSLRKYVPS